MKEANMAKRNSLLVPDSAPQTAELEASRSEPSAAPKRRKASAERSHIGGYFDPNDPITEEFRILAVRSRRTQQDLLAEAIALVVEKYRTQERFGGAL
jgi:hypothetical protein